MISSIGTVSRLSNEISERSTGGRHEKKKIARCFRHYYKKIDCAVLPSLETKIIAFPQNGKKDGSNWNWRVARSCHRRISDKVSEAGPIDTPVPLVFPVLVVRVQ